MPKSMWWRYISIAVIAGACVYILAVLTYFHDQFQTHTVVADEPMTWQCTSNTQIYPGPVVLLRFTRAPVYLRFYADPDGSFCRFISQSGKRTVMARFNVWGNKRHGMVGWNEISYDGRTPPESAIVGGSARDSAPQTPGTLRRGLQRRLTPLSSVDLPAKHAPITTTEESIVWIRCCSFPAHNHPTSSARPPSP